MNIKQINVRSKMEQMVPTKLLNTFDSSRYFSASLPIRRYASSRLVAFAGFLAVQAVMEARNKRPLMSWFIAGSASSLIYSMLTYREQVVWAKTWKNVQQREEVISAALDDWEKNLPSEAMMDPITVEEVKEAVKEIFQPMMARKVREGESFIPQESDTSWISHTTGAPESEGEGQA